MKRNTMLTFVALLMVVIIGAGGAYWAVKKYRAQKRAANQEFRYEVKMGQVKEGFDIDAFKKQVLTDELLDQMIEEHHLVDVWGLTDSAAAKERVKKKFTVNLVASEVKVSYQDKNKELAQKILRSIVNGYLVKVQGRQAIAP